MQVLIIVHQHTRADEALRTSIEQYSHGVTHQLISHCGYGSLIVYVSELATDLLRDFLEELSS